MVLLSQIVCRSRRCSVACDLVDKFLLCPAVQEAAEQSSQHQAAQYQLVQRFRTAVVSADDCQSQLTSSGRHIAGKFVRCF